MTIPIFIPTSVISLHPPTKEEFERKSIDLGSYVEKIKTKTDEELKSREEVE